MSRFALLLALAVPVSAFAADPKPKELLTRKYEVADLLKGAADPTSAVEQVVAAITNIQPSAWAHGSDSGYRLRVVGDALEVRTTTDIHKEIAEVLTALRRLNDLAVDVEVAVFAVDPQALGKELPVDPKGGPATISDDDWAKFAKGQKPADTTTTRLRNGQTGPVHTDRRAFTYRAKFINEEPLFRTVSPKVEFEGTTLTANVVVSSDRRFVKVTLTEATRTLLELEQSKITVSLPVARNQAPFAPLQVTVETPRMKEDKSAVNRTVDDGTRLVLPLKFVDRDRAGKVLVAVVRPTIFIQAEEDERKKN